MTQLPSRIETDADSVARDLGRLVLTIVELVRQLMERQAIRRVEAGELPPATVERLGLGLMKLEEAMADLRAHFGLRPEDLNVDLGPLGHLLPPTGSDEDSARKDEKESIRTREAKGAPSVDDDAK
jgi:hypothetical protein